MVSVTQQFDDMLNPKKKKEGDQLAAESTSIDGGGAAQPAAAGAPSSANYTKSSFQSPSKIMKANTQSTGIDLTGTYEDQASKVRTSLKSEKDSNYTKLRDARVQPVDQSQFDAAIDGDQTAQGKVSGVLNGKFQKPTYESSVSTDINDLDSLQNSGGIAALLRQRGSPNYTSGMANLDARLFQNNPMAGEQINKARDIARSVRKEGEDQRSAFAKDAGDAESEFTGSQQTLRDMLSGKRQSIQDKIREQTYGRKHQRTSGVTDLDNRLNKVLSEGSGGKLNPRLMDVLNKVDKSKFAGTDFSGDVVDATQARQLNNIQRLSGEGGTMYNENAGTFQQAQGEGYEQALREELTKFRDSEAAADNANKEVLADPTLPTRRGQVENPNDPAPGQFTPIPGGPDFKNPMPEIPGTPAPMSPNIPTARSPLADVRQPGSVDIGGIKVNANPVETLVSTATGGRVRTPTEILADLMGQGPKSTGVSSGQTEFDKVGTFNPVLNPGGGATVNLRDAAFDSLKDFKGPDYTGFKGLEANTGPQLGAAGDITKMPGYIAPTQPKNVEPPAKLADGSSNPKYWEWLFNPNK